MDELHNVSAQNPTNGQTLIYNESTSLWEKNTLTDGTGISVTEGAGSITIANTGVTSLTGTANEIDVSASTGGVTLSLPATINADTTGNAATVTNGAYVNVANTFSTNQVINVNSSSTALRVTQTGTGNALVVEDAANPDSTPFVIDANGRLVVGNTASINATTATEPFLQVHGSNAGAQVEVLRFGANALGDGIVLAKSRGSLGVNTIVSSGDTLGDITYRGADGTGYITAASISAAVDGTPGTNDMPGRLVFSTTADGAATPTERMRIDSSGNINIATAGARITGDFSNATVANRVAFQTSTTNSNTALATIPNGTASFSGWQFFNNTTPDNAAFLQVGASSTAAGIVSGTFGTGTYLPMTFFTGGSERMRVDTSGNVGIGTTSPESFGGGHKTLELSGSTTTEGGVFKTATSGSAGSGSSGTEMIMFTDSVGGKINVVSSHPAIFYTANTERARIDSSGKVGIGTSAPGSSLEVNGGIRARGGAPGAMGVNNNGYAFAGNGGDTDGGMFSSVNGQIEFYTDSIEKFRIAPAGQLGIGGANYGTSGQILTSNGAAAAPSWSSLTTAQVNGAIAGSSADGVGTYAFLATNGEGAASAGRTLAGSNLQYAGGGNDTNSGNGSVFERSGGVSGTWRQMGYQKSYQAAVKATLWLRIS
jgi:hypothetical protein